MTTDLRVFSTSVSTARRYRSIRGESFLPFSNGIFETRMFFWFIGLIEVHVVSRLCGTILKKSGISEDDIDVSDSERRVLLLC